MAGNESLLGKKCEARLGMTGKSYKSYTMSIRLYYESSTRMKNNNNCNIKI